VVAREEEQAARVTVQEGKARDLGSAAEEWAEVARALAGLEVVGALVQAEADCGSPAECPGAVADLAAGLDLAALAEDPEAGLVEVRGAEVDRAVGVRVGLGLVVALVGEVGPAVGVVRLKEEVLEGQGEPAEVEG
jgi:hypothetical protein